MEAVQVAGWMEVVVGAHPLCTPLVVRWLVWEEDLVRGLGCLAEWGGVGAWGEWEWWEWDWGEWEWGSTAATRAAMVETKTFRCRRPSTRVSPRCLSYAVFFFRSSMTVCASCTRPSMSLHSLTCLWSFLLMISVASHISPHVYTHVLFHFVSVIRHRPRADQCLRTGQWMLMVEPGKKEQAICLCRQRSARTAVEAFYESV